MLAKFLVTVFGFALIVLVNWYFFFSRKKAVSAEVKRTGVQEVKIVVKGGYDPDVIVVKKGVPVRQAVFFLNKDHKTRKAQKYPCLITS